MKGRCAPVVLRGVTVVNPGLEPLENHDIHIAENGMIESVSPADAQPARGAELDARELVAFPGLIDAHVHLCFSPHHHPQDLLSGMEHAEIEELVATNARDTLARGVTTVRDLGGPGDMVRNLKRRIADGELLGPRVQCAGPPLTKPGGHCWFIGDVVQGQDELVDTIERHGESDDEWLKLMVTGGMLTRGSDPEHLQFHPVELEEAVRNAKRLGLETAAHVLSAEGVMAAVQAGIRTIEHGVGLTRDIARTMCDHDQVLVPTLAASRLALIASPDSDEEDMVQARALEASHWRSVRWAIEAGVAIVTGSDAGCPDVPHGSAAAEVDLLEQAGLDRAQALMAATSVAARVLGLTHVGRLEAGFCADLLLLGADPTADLSTLANPLAVYAGGKRVATEGAATI